MSMFAWTRTACLLPVQKGLSVKVPRLGPYVIRAAATVRCMSAEPAPHRRSLVFLEPPVLLQMCSTCCLTCCLMRPKEAVVYLRSDPLFLRCLDQQMIPKNNTTDQQSAEIHQSSSWHRQFRSISQLVDPSLILAFLQVRAVVTQPPSTRRRGRKQLPSPVEQLALDRNIPSARIFSPTKVGEEAFMAELKRLKPDLCVTAAYGNILPNKFLATPICGTVNVHPSLLPLYRGAAPVQRAVQDGANVSGVTLAYTVRALDAGPVIASESMDVDSNMKAPEILRILFQKGSELLLKELPAILDGTARAKALEQDHAKATLAPKVTVEKSWLNFEQPAEILHNKVRAFAEWPGSRAAFLLRSASGKVQTSELKVVPTRVGCSGFGSTDGREVTLVNDALLVPCGGNSALEIVQLQPLAKKVMSARDFWNGLRGQTLWKDVNGNMRDCICMHSRGFKT